jgi:hypothetical protein
MTAEGLVGSPTFFLNQLDQMATPFSISIDSVIFSFLNFFCNNAHSKE